MKYLLIRYKEQILYIIFGITSTLVNFLIYFLLLKANMYYLMSNIIAIGISIIFAYVTNKFFVFKSSANSLKKIFKEFTSFISFRIISMIFDLVLIFILVSVLHINDYLAKIITGILVIVLNYLFSKFIIFTNKKVYL